MPSRISSPGPRILFGDLDAAIQAAGRDDCDQQHESSVPCADLEGIRQKRMPKLPYVRRTGLGEQAAGALPRIGQNPPAITM